ncbi:MAG: MlaD family protein [Verrucomicrobiota bacterium]
MKNSLETRLGMFVALIVIAAFFIMFIVGGFEKFQNGTRVEAYFKSAQELKPGDRVKMAGVEIGKVEGISLATNRVKVVMRLRENVPVKTDSTARIQFAGLMGQNFVSLDFGSEKAPLARTAPRSVPVEQPDLSAIMQKLDNVASGVENLTRVSPATRLTACSARSSVSCRITASRSRPPSPTCAPPPPRSPKARARSGN